MNKQLSYLMVGSSLSTRDSIQRNHVTAYHTASRLAPLHRTRLIKPLMYGAFIFLILFCSCLINVVFAQTTNTAQTNRQIDFVLVNPDGTYDYGVKTLGLCNKPNITFGEKCLSPDGIEPYYSYYTCETHTREKRKEYVLYNGKCYLLGATVCPSGTVNAPGQPANYCFDSRIVANVATQIARNTPPPVDVKNQVAEARILSDPSNDCCWRAGIYNSFKVELLKAIPGTNLPQGWNGWLITEMLTAERNNIPTSLNKAAGNNQSSLFKPGDLCKLTLSGVQQFGRWEVKAAVCTGERDLAAEKVFAEKLATEKAAADKLAAEKAASDKRIAEAVAAERAAAAAKLKQEEEAKALQARLAADKQKKELDAEQKRRDELARNPNVLAREDFQKAYDNCLGKSVKTPALDSKCSLVGYEAAKRRCEFMAKVGKRCDGW